jgi:CspA family cold shock protein
MDRHRGTVIKYNVERGFGFIAVEGKREDAFIHYKDIDPGVDAFKKLLPGDSVEFDIENGNRGLVAKNLQITASREPNGS